MKTPFRIAVAVLLGAASLSAAAAVTATLDRDEIAPGETVELLLQRDDRSGGDPDLAPLKKDFDVLGSSSGSSIQFINGHMAAKRELHLTLTPKHSGKLQVPPLSWGGEQSQPLELSVTDSAAGGQSGAQPGSQAGATAGSQHVFLTTSLDQPRPYVQSAVVLTVQLHVDVQLYQASLELNGNGDLPVQQIGKDRQTSEMNNGHRYQVIERKYLLQPQRSGTLSLDGPVVEAQVADASRDPFGNAFGGMFNATRPLRLHGDPIQLEVRARPAAATGPDWLPAQQVNLEEAWRPDNGAVHAGEPLTLHLRLAAHGLTGAQLPDLSTRLVLPDGLKAYPDQAKLGTDLQSGELVGSREQDIALIASRPGHYELPDVHLSWWDTRQDQQREAILPGRTLDILPAVGAAAAPAPQSSVQPAASAGVPA
ncbi:MAG: BatD family protein, partial [Nevskia sp.]|nr:BatD family protein [Nevskia sp.]